MNSRSESATLFLKGSMITFASLQKVMKMCRNDTSIEAILFDAFVLRNGYLNCASA